MFLRRSAIAVSALSLLAFVAIAGCSSEPEPTAPETPPQLTRILNAAGIRSDNEEIRKLELLARAHVCFHFAPGDTVIKLWPSVEDLPPHMRLRAEEAGTR